MSVFYQGIMYFISPFSPSFKTMLKSSCMIGSWSHSVILLEAILDTWQSYRLRVSQGEAEKENCYAVSEGCVFSHCSTSLSALAELKLQSRKRGFSVKMVVSQLITVSLFIGNRGPLPKEGASPFPFLSVSCHLAFSWLYLKICKGRVGARCVLLCPNAHCTITDVSVGSHIEMPLNWSSMS